MMRGQSRSITLPAVLIASALSLSLFDYTLMEPLETDPATQTEMENKGSIALEPLSFQGFAMQPLGDFFETLDRPLFMATRRPLPPPSPKLVQEKPEPRTPLKLALKGVMFSDATRVAILAPETQARSQEQKQIRILEGEEYQGWKLVHVAPKQVTFQRGAAERLLVVPFKPERSPTDRRQYKRPNLRW